MSQLQAKANYSRICQLLIGKGGNAFRAVLQTKINRSPPPSTLDSFLKANKKFLRNLRVITPTQWNLLFPASGSPDSNNFDITLLTVLLRNICGLHPPTAGWNIEPAASDTSESAEILRIRNLRNKVYGHIPCPQLDNTKFETLWQEISKSLIKLGIPQQDIEELKQTPLSPEEENYIEKLKEWKELEDDLLSKLNEVKEEFGDVKKKVIDVENEVVELRTKNAKSSGIEKLAKFFFKGKVEELSKKFQEGTREWFLKDFKKWFDDEKSRVMILTARPGMGKSVLSAKICELYHENGQLAACHFCDFRKSDYRDPHRILQGLASQMSINVDGFREKLTEVLSREHSRDSLSDLFRVLLNDPLHALEGNEPMLVVVDGLDESKTAVKSEFLELISEEFSQLPKWIKIFITSRPEIHVKNKLEHLNPLEILPDDEQHQQDLKQFIKCCLPKVSVPDVESFVDKCEGSFLYAYYLVNEVKQLQFKPNVDRYVPPGISKFYEKQFKRLKTELQCFKQNRTEVSMFKTFVNVVAASEEPLPFRFLLTCMGLSSEEFEIRQMILGIMSEVLPVYDDCLTVFHKSLWDWLKLDGYEEHAFAADVADGEKRLWGACKKVYTDIDSLCTASDFQIPGEKRYALKNGVKYLIKVDNVEDFQWLLNVKVNYFKFKYDHPIRDHFVLFDVLQKYKSRLSDDLYWGLYQLYAFLKDNCIDEYLCYKYLQCFANKLFGCVHNANTFTKDAREILNETNTIWLEKVTNETGSSFKIISHALFKYDAVSLSPDNKLLAWRKECRLKVFELPSFTEIFQLGVSVVKSADPCITFSPDSSYFLLNSLRTCICLRSQGKIPFIPHGPAKILSCSFSSCGTKLATLEKESIKVWNVREKELLAESQHKFKIWESLCFGIYESVVFVADNDGICPFKIFDSMTLKELKMKETHSYATKYDNSIQMLSPPSSKFWSGFDKDTIWQLPEGKNIFCAGKYCSKSFTWKGTKCVMTSNGSLSLILYDYINQEIIDTFEISCLPCYKSVDYISNLGENNFLICLNGHAMFVLSLESSSKSFTFPFINHKEYPIFCALSPDNLYVACSYGSPILKIMNVNNGETLQSVAPKQKPIACWWSGLYLWVVCEGLVVVKYPYTSTHRNVVENEVEECAIDCRSHVLKFAQGVLVTKVDGQISIRKICGERSESLSPQQILYSKFDSKVLYPRIAVSSDSCAVLLYGRYCYEDRTYIYELWELECQGKWKLFSTGMFHRLIFAGCLTGEKNSRSFLCLSMEQLSSIDLTNGTKRALYQFPIDVAEIIYVDPNLLIYYAEEEIHFIHVSYGKVVISIYVGKVSDFFFVPSKHLLLAFIGNGVIEHYLIHNLDKYLPL